ncbi:MAG: tetratricopeptide repeat protein [Verrucomicrobiota bacterium]
MMDQQSDEQGGSGQEAPQPAGGEFQTATTASSGSRKLLSLGICLGLALGVWMVFGRTVGYEFVNYDDDVYVYANAQVSQGLSLRGIEWALRHSVNSNWHPLTMMSYMLDYQLHGLKAGGYHLTNVLLHTAAVILLFLVLSKMTGALWRSAFVAAVFAIHPLRVESVAWVAERKDVLSGLFFMLTLGAYVWYVREPQRWSRYLAVLLFFALGLMSKPILVTLPFVLLLLDYWPLKRFTAAVNGPKYSCIPGRLILEKIPLFALSAAGCLAALVTQEKVIAALPFSMRAGNACVSYATYLWQMVYPRDLAVYYPFKERGLPLWEVALSFLLLVLVSALALSWRHKRPWLLVGWLWYLGMLVPVIGLVQAGRQAHADRYTYLPQIGLYVMITWAASDWVAGRRYGRLGLGSAAAAMLVALILGAGTQVSYWSNSRALWEHTLAVSGDTELAHNNLGTALVQQGQLNEAITQFLQALKINPDYALARINLGNAFRQSGKVDEAIAQYQLALNSNPDSDAAHNNLGIALVQIGKVDEAIIQYQQALKINPDFDLARNNLGDALAKKGRLDEAIAQYQQALKINPNFDLACIKLGNAFLQKGKTDDAIAQYQRALKINPDFDTAHNDLGIALYQKGQLDEAISQFLQALKIKPDYALAHYNLGNAFLRKGQLDEAITQYQQAVKIDPNFEPAHNSLGYALLQKGQLDEAIAHYERALEINPANAGQCNHLAWRLATHPDAAVRHGNVALELAQKLNQLPGNKDPAILRTLAAAYAETKQFPEAMATARQALQLASVRSNTTLVNDLQRQIECYQAGLPFRDATLTNAAFPHP